MGLFFQLLGNGVVAGAVAILYAIGFGFVYRSLKVFHIALGAEFVFAAYMFYTFLVVAKLPLVAAVVLTLFSSAGLSALIEYAVYRPFALKRSSSGVVMIASLGVMIVVENLIALIYGNEVKTVSSALEPSILMGSLRFTRIQLLELLVGLGLFGLVGAALKLGRWSKAVWALGDQPELVPVMGLPINKLRLMMITLSGLLTASAAMLVSWDIGMDPHIGMHYLLIGSVAVFFGGVDRYWAWGAGAMTLSVLQSLAVWRFSAQWTDLVTFGALVFVLVFRPQGLFGLSKRLEESK